MIEGTVIVLALYALLETIISLLFSGAMWIAKAIMDSSITVFSGSQNMIKTFVDLLPFSGGEGSNVLNISSIMNGVSYGILALVIFVAIIRSITAPLTGDEADNPIQVVIRVVIALIAKTLIFGSGLFDFNGLLGVFGNWFGLILSKISMAYNYSAFEGLSAGLTLNAAAYIGQLVLFASLLGSVLGAAITYIERILSFAAYIIIGPVAVSLYAYKDTAEIARQWVMGIFTQFGAIALNLALWAAFLNQIDSISGLYISGWQIDDLIFKLAVAIAILGVIRNSEKIFNMFGLRTMANGESARALTGGVASIASGALMAFRMAPMAREGLARGMHGSMPAQGGRNGGSMTGNPAMPYTGNASLYDSKGNLSVKGADGQGSNAVRRAIARSGGNIASNISGPLSTRAAQYRQASAVENLSNAVHGQNPGYKVTGADISDGKGKDAKSYSGVQLGNLALSGHENGSGNGLRFMGSAAGQVSAGEGGSGSTSVFSSSDMVVGTTNSLNGTTVKGVVGNAVYENGGNGRVSNMGSYFMPVENGGAANQIASGSKVDIGDGKDWYITGDGITIDDFGAKVYELATPPEAARVEIANMSDFEDLLSFVNDGERDIPDPVIDVQEYGKDNLFDNDQFDPSGMFEDKE